MTLSEQQRQWIRFWLPAILCGFIVWLMFLLVGNTPFTRATGLAVAIVGMTLSLRRMGSLLAIIGGLTLATSPIFWSQTGGAEGDPATIVIALIIAGVTAIIGTFALKRPTIALGLGIVAFAILFSSQLGTPRSIRLTGFVVTWLMFLLFDMLLLTNPHPDQDSAPPPILLTRIKTLIDDASQYPAQLYHTLGILLLFAIGILNDPLLVLLAPAIILALQLTRTQLPIWYWLAIGFVIALGIRGIFVDYLAVQAHFFIVDQWRYAERWISMVELIISQFGIIGIILSVLGLARLARWHPPLGGVTMLAYGAYIFLGLIYIAPTRELLLLPLYIIQVLWMTYAIFTLGEWAKKTFKQVGYFLRWGIYLFYVVVLPLQAILVILS